MFSVVMMLCFMATGYFSFKVLMEFKRTGVVPNEVYKGRSASASGKADESSYSQSHKEDDEAFDSRLNVGHGREDGYSFEEARVHGGAPTGYTGGYETVPGGEEYSHAGRPTSFGGPLGGNRI